MTAKWWRKAACRNYDLALWFPEPSKRNRYNTARKICAVCPVKVQCLREATEARVPYGMWGGLTPYERGWRGPRALTDTSAQVGHGDAAGTVSGF